METRANFALIGAFTLAVIAAAFGFVFWFSGPSKAARRVPYDIIFTGSVSGLSRGGGVTFNGLRVGDVKDLELNPANPSEVIARVEIDRRTPVKTDTRARLEYQGLTGVASVALFGGSADAAPLTALENQSVPTVRGDPSQFQDLIETAQRIATQLGDFTSRASKLIDENADAIASTIKNAQKFSAALGENSDGLKDLMASLGDLGRASKPLVASLQELSKDADNVVKAIDPQKVKSIVADVQKAAAKLDSTLGGLDSFLGSSKGQVGPTFADVGEAARSIRRLADNLDVRLKEIAGNIARFSGSGLRQYEALAVDGRKTLNEINRAVRQLEKDPSQIIFGGKPKLPEYNGP